MHGSRPHTRAYMPKKNNVYRKYFVVELYRSCNAHAHDPHIFSLKFFFTEKNVTTTLLQYMVCKIHIMIISTLHAYFPHHNQLHLLYVFRGVGAGGAGETPAPPPPQYI